jgi:hypothetical protein
MITISIDPQTSAYVVETARETLTALLLVDVAGIIVAAGDDYDCEGLAETLVARLGERVRALRQRPFDITVYCEACGAELDPADAVLSCDEMVCCDCADRREIADEGLRLAGEDQPGWTMRLRSGAVVWVTDEPAA